MSQMSPTTFLPTSSKPPCHPIYLLTCPSSHEPTLSRADDTLLHTALMDRGFPCQSVVWSAPRFNWERFARHASAVIVRSAWDYYVNRERFLDILTTVATHTLLVNPLEVIRWNTHKSYLHDLETLGIPIVPTVWVEPGMAIDIASYGWHKAVLKPVVATNAYHTLLFTHRQCQLAEAHVAACGTAMLLQPFFESVLTTGEIALVVIEGQYSHAFRKQCAVAEDTQPEHPILPTSTAIVCAEQVLSAIARRFHLSGPEAFVFARVDLVADVEGHYCIMEVELTEPRLRLFDEPTAAGRLADAIVRVVSPHTHRGNNPLAQ